MNPEDPDNSNRISQLEMEICELEITVQMQRKLIARASWELHQHSIDYHHVVQKPFLDALKLATGSERYP